MTNVAARNEAYAEEGCQYRSRLEDYLEWLVGEGAYEEFRDSHYGTPEYYALVASLAA